MGGERIASDADLDDRSVQGLYDSEEAWVGTERGAGGGPDYVYLGTMARDNVASPRFSADAARSLAGLLLAAADELDARKP